MKYWNGKRSLRQHTSEDISVQTNNEISDSNIKCENFAGQLWNDTKQNIKLLKKLHILVRLLNNIENEPGECIFGV